ncbi:MAG: site-2 protease family protein [Saprospiraceae bacterium]|nr:site-2 protease family protein [Saprospiraceae bacterium]MDW8228951.1 site-2 protease family protein [Saprospiraceae bacterium]
MRGSLKIFTWLGIPVHIHWTFLLIFVYVFWLGHSNDLGLWNTLWITGFFLALFACVLLHEYGHALAARHYGVRTQDIILTPIGGVARLEYMPEKPMQEFVVAIAGPLVNVVLALALYLLAWLLFSEEHWFIFQWLMEQHLLFGQSESGELDIALAPLASGGLLYLSALIAANVALVVFNLIPAFPMDGGRIFRAMLAARMSRVRATQVAAWLGQGIAMLFIAIGLWQGAFTLALVGLFVFILARAENRNVQLDALLRQYKAADLMRPSFTRLTTTDWMQTPIHLLQVGLEQHFLVFDLQDHLVGVLEEPSILEALRKRDYTAPVEKYLSPKVQVVSSEARLEYIYFLMQQQGVRLAAVAGRGELVGVIDEAGLAQFLKMHR